MQPISSSPQLLGICEEGEDDESSGGRQTYSTVRMIRPRQAVVSPDVIRRYDKRVGVSRSRRSTSCSSSETSDDEERRLCLISSHCRKGDASDRDDDHDPPPAAGGRDDRVYGRRDQKHGLYHSSSGKGGASDDPNGTGGPPTTTAASSSSTASRRRKQLDPRKLAHKLQKLALAPIREVPSIVLSRFGAGRTHLMEEARDWFRPLVKPRSCEHLPSKSSRRPALPTKKDDCECNSRDSPSTLSERKSLGETSCSSSASSSSSSLYLGLSRTTQESESAVVAGSKLKHKVKKKRKCFSKLKAFVSGEVRFENHNGRQNTNFLAVRTATMASCNGNLRKTR